MAADSKEAGPRGGAPWYDGPLRSAALLWLSLMPVAFGVWFGYDYVPRRDHNDFPGFAISQPPPGLLRSFGNWDGVWYRDIARAGYRYDPEEGSYVVFFPGYPLLGAAVSRLTGLDELSALLLVAHASLLGCVLLHREYLRCRYAGMTDEKADVACLVMLLFPTTFFFRMAYAESLFLLLVLAILYGIQRRWPPFAVALLVGAATGVRAVGVGLIAVWLCYLWRRQTDTPGARFGPEGTQGRLMRFVPRAGLMLPLSAWGLIAYMVFLWGRFGDPLLFQSHHAVFDGRDHVPWGEKLGNLLTLEPIRSVYTAGSVVYWAEFEPIVNPAFTLRFLNPLYFLAACGLVAVGAWKRWLNSYEILLSAVLLGIPYVTKGHDGGMLGVARYCTVIPPAFSVLALVLMKSPEALRTSWLAASAALLAFYSALFAAWHTFI